MISSMSCHFLIEYFYLSFQSVSTFNYFNGLIYGVDPTTEEYNVSDLREVSDVPSPA